MNDISDGKQSKSMIYWHTNVDR